MAHFVEAIDVTKMLNGGVEFEVDYNNTFDPNLDVDSKKVKEEYFDKVSEYINLDCLQVTDDEYNSEPFAVLASKMTDLSPCGKVKKRVIREGYGDLPSENYRVNVHYNAYIELEPIPFDSTYARKRPEAFSSGEGLIGFQIAIKSMKVNEKSHFIVHPDFAYRDSGLRRIPPNSTVLFEIEMLGFINENSDQVGQIKEFGDVLQYCQAIIAQAKEMFELKNYAGALKQYFKGMRKLENAQLADYADQLKYDAMLLKLHTNIVVCSTKMENYKRGCFHANQVLNLAKNGTIQVPAKVYFNNAKCLMELGDFAMADRRLKVARRLEPNNKEIKALLIELGKREFSGTDDK